MKYVTLLNTLLLALPLAANATDVDTRIINGSATSSSEFPSIASLVSEEGGYYSIYCGATILDNYHVLTAAHCIYPESSSNRIIDTTYVAPQLDYKTDYANGSSYKVKALEVYYPSGYRDSAAVYWPYDIAIVKVSQSLRVSSSDFADRGQISEQDDYNNTSIDHFAVGHGYVDNAQNDVDQLQYTTLNVVDNCSSIATDNRICTTGAESFSSGLNNSTCNGDSGGPLYWNDNGRQVQIGITSFGPTICGLDSDNFTSVFTEVAAYNDWIDDVLNGRESPTLIVGSNPFDFGSSGGSLGGVSLFMAMFIVAVRRQKK